MSRRMIIEMGQGSDLHGQDYTKAAARAITDAMRHSSLPIIAGLDLEPDMEVRVTVGVQAPESVDCAALAADMPRGQAVVRAVPGGMDLVNPDTGDVTVIAAAAIEVFLPQQTGWRLRRRAN